MTTFFGRRIDAMYQGCSRSSLVAVSTRERAIRRTFYELCIKGWTLSFFSSPSFESIKVRCQCCCKKQIDNNFPCPTIFFTITEQFLARWLVEGNGWNTNISWKGRYCGAICFPLPCASDFPRNCGRVVSLQSIEHFDVIFMIDKKNCCRFVK